MGCNTSQEQLQPANVIENQEENNENQSNGENNENKEPDDSKIVTCQETAEQASDIHSNDNLDKITNCDNFINDYSKDNNEGRSEDKNRNVDEIKENIAVIKSEMEHSKELDSEERAATKIQATFRGHKVRASMKQGDSKSTAASTMDKKCDDKQKTTNATASAGASSKIDVPDLEEEEMTKEQLEAEFDPDDKELCDAATRIQSAFRGHLHRKLQTSDIKDDKDLEEITKKVAEELDIDLSDPELNKAATKIQASFRGYKTRKTD